MAVVGGRVVLDTSHRRQGLTSPLLTEVFHCFIIIGEKEGHPLMSLYLSREVSDIPFLILSKIKIYILMFYHDVAHRQLLRVSYFLRY